MTKADLIDDVSRLAELTRKDSEAIVESIFESVVRSLRAGHKIEIRGFGSFRSQISQTSRRSFSFSGAMAQSSMTRTSMRPSRAKKLRKLPSARVLATLRR